MSVTSWLYGNSFILEDAFFQHLQIQQTHKNDKCHRMWEGLSCTYSKLTPACVNNKKQEKNFPQKFTLDALLKTGCDLAT